MDNNGGHQFFVLVITTTTPPSSDDNWLGLGQVWQARTQSAYKYGWPNFPNLPGVLFYFENPEPAETIHTSLYPTQPVVVILYYKVRVFKENIYYIQVGLGQVKSSPVIKKSCPSGSGKNHHRHPSPHPHPPRHHTKKTQKYLYESRTISCQNTWKAKWRSKKLVKSTLQAIIN